MVGLGVATMATVVAVVAVVEVVAVVAVAMVEIPPILRQKMTTLVGLEMKMMQVIVEIITSYCKWHCLDCSMGLLSRR